jgi:aminoglycoside/choline kinase family phosphotransferase
LRAHDIPVPRIYAQDIEHGLLLLEDLSDETFEAHLRRSPESAWEEPYRRAIDLLARVHALPEHSHASESIALRRLYETELLRSELDHFREWGLEALSGPLPTTERAELDAHFDALTAKIVALPQGLVHRDFQSRNLMCPPDGRLVVLDFQDAFIGPAAYDLVALLCDSYVALNAELQESMLFRYAQQRDYTAAQLIELTRAFRLLTVQRKLKDAGRFIFIDRVRQNPSFLQYYPGSLAYVARALRELPDLAELQSFLRRHVASFPTS